MVISAKFPYTFSRTYRRGEFSIFSEKKPDRSIFFVFSKTFSYLCVVRGQI